MCKEPGENLTEDDTTLGLVVRNEAGILNKLGHVDLIEMEASNLGDELRAFGA